MNKALSESNKSWQMELNQMKAWLMGMAAKATRRGALMITVMATLASSPVLAEAAPPIGQVYEVETGGQLSIKLEKPAHRVAVGDGDIAKVKVIGSKELLVQGIKPGTTSLLVWSKGAADPTNNRIQVNTAVNPSLLSSFPALRLKSSNDLVLLGGTAPDMESHELAKNIAKHADGTGKAQVADNAQLAYGGEVQVDVRVVELSRKVLKETGLNLISSASSITFGTFKSGSLKKVTASPPDGISVEWAESPVSSALELLIGSSSGDVMGLLTLLEHNGFGRTLAQPTLVARNGQTASFLAGGEFPVPVPQALGQTTIQYKPYGIRLDVSPTVLGENRIALKVAPEVSDLDFTNSISINGVTVPSLLTRRADTSVELGNGESFIIGGLVSQSVVKNLDKVPGLGDIPVLGAFFKASRLSREDKELLIIVTPRLVRPIAANANLGPLPGAELSDYNPSLWKMLLMSDQEEASRFTGLSE